MLYVVSTPIGNLKDITYRAVQILQSCEIILCEDTRRISTLLKNYNILKKELIIYNDINKKKQTPKIINLLKNQKEICLVSDAGTPAINDPGFYLIRECVKHNIKLIPVPGPTSIISALVCSGIPTDKFSYLGFIPKTKGKRQKFIQEIRNLKTTTIMLESPHRILKTLEEMVKIIPGFNIVLAREMTKKFEEFIRGKPQEILDIYKSKTPKGEYVIIIDSGA